MESQVTEARNEPAFFLADVEHPAIKSDVHTMAYPVFALHSAEKTIRKYHLGETRIEIDPSVHGRATIFDKDLWIYAISHLVTALESDREDIGPTVQFSVSNFLETTQRSKGGNTFKTVELALKRLAGTRIRTNVKTGSILVDENFGLIDKYRIVSKGSPKRRDPSVISITLPEWLYRAVMEREVLTISPNYFKLRRPLDRKLYEIARKHCAKKRGWSIGLEKLWQKTGARMTQIRFRHEMKKIAKAQHIPEYTVDYDDARDLVTFGFVEPGKEGESKSQGRPKQSAGARGNPVPKDASRKHENREAEVRTAASGPKAVSDYLREMKGVCR